MCRESKTAWVLPSTYYWVRIDECLTAADASGAGGKKGFGPGVVSAAISNALGEGWCGAFFGTVPESECVSTAGTIRFEPVDITRVHAYYAAVVSAVNKKVASHELSGVPISTARLANKVAVDWLREAIPYRKETASSWAFCVRQSSHLSSVALHHADALAEAGGERCISGPLRSMSNSSSPQLTAGS